MSDSLEQWIHGASVNEFGDWGERFWSGIFASADLGYIPLHTASKSGAPMLRGREQLILPDFQVVGSQVNIYVDSKAKKHPVLFRLKNEVRHGINTRNLDHYQTFSMKMHNQCALAIFEAFTDETDAEWSGALLLQTIGRLEQFKREGVGSVAGEMTYWPRNKFVLLGNVSPEDASRIACFNGAGARFSEAVLKVFSVLPAEARA